MRTLFVFLFVLSGFGAGVANAAAQDDVTVDRTNIRFVLPYTPDGLASGLTVSDEASGFCTGLSLANIGRPDAWSCNDTATNEIFDPCFENPFTDPDAAAELACMSSPFATEVVRFTTSEPLPRFKDVPAADAAPVPPPVVGPPDQGGNIQIMLPSPASDGIAGAEETIDPLDIPWALELANGARCGLMTGATAVLAGERMNYACDDGGYVLGEVDRSAPAWTVSYLAEDAFATDLVPIAVAWT